MDSKIINFSILIFFLTFKSYAVEFHGKFIQGHFIVGKTKPDFRVVIDKKEIKVSKEGYFAFGIDKDRKYDIIIKLLNRIKMKMQYIHQYLHFYLHHL